MSETDTTCRAVVIYESMFGNGEKIARAVVDGLRSRQYEAAAVDVRWADPIDSFHIDLIVIGAPTHAFSLSRPSTRTDAVHQGASASHGTTGLREWLGALRLDETRPPFAVFDTRVAKLRRLPTNAGRTAAKLVRRRGFHVLEGIQGFLVNDVRGPLVAGEVERALQWGQSLAEKAHAFNEARQLTVPEKL